MGRGGGVRFRGTDRPRWPSKFQGSRMLEMICNHLRWGQWPSGGGFEVSHPCKERERMGHPSFSS